MFRFPSFSVHAWCIAKAAVFWGTLVVAAWGAMAVVPPHLPALPDLDRREPKLGPTVAQSQAAGRLQRQHANLRIDFDPVLASPSSVACLDGCLPCGAGGGEAAEEDPAQATVGTFLDEQRLLFGHGRELMGTLRLQTDYRTAHNGLRTLIWQQESDGLPVWGARLVSHLTRENRLVAMSSHCLPIPPGRGGGPIEPLIGPSQAIQSGATHLGGPHSGGLIETEPSSGWRRFFGPDLRGASYVRLVWLPVGNQPLRLCWELILTPTLRQEMYRLVLDATTQEVWVRHCLTDHASPASYHVFTSDSPRPLSPGHAIPLTNEPVLVEREWVEVAALNDLASPEGWIDPADNFTRGNNVYAHLDRDNNDQPDLPIPEGSPARVFDFPIDLSANPASYGFASVVQLFYWNNWMHDRLYSLGFTEEAGNFQLKNFDRGGLGGDPVVADAQNGGETDNANFSTPPDGLPPRMQMYIWTAPHPDRDAAFDAEVVLHEYAHGLTHRLVGAAGGLSALQARGLGEGWSDFYSLALLSEETDPVDGNYALGAYLAQRAGANSQHYYFGLRRYPYTTDLLKNPLTFRDIDPTQAHSHSGIPRSPATSPQAVQIHNMGEIWCAALWEARAELIRKHGFSAGNNLILQLVTDALRLTPANPTYIQARDAVLIAERILTGGENQTELWAGFAKRGLGFSAQAPPSHTTTGVGEAFDLPDPLVISPLVAQVAQGPLAGPFQPNRFSYALSNSEPEMVSWSAGVDVPWLQISPTAGRLDSDPIELTAQLTSAARLLPVGLHTATVTVTNETSQRVQSRTVNLGVGQSPPYTELFQAADNDVAFQSWTFTPDTQGYSLCRTPIQAFPTDPSGGTPLALGDEALIEIALADSREVVFFGTRYRSFTVGSNGYLTFGEVEQGKTETVEAHFRRVRLSALFDDLDPGAAGSVSWKQLQDRVVVSYWDVPETFTANTNRFQIELFFDGRLRLSYLQIDALDGLVGISPGTGIPDRFVETDFSSVPECSTLLSLGLPETVGELQVGQIGSVQLPHPASSNVLIQLSSDLPGQLQVQPQVLVLLGQSAATFLLHPIDDLLFDGPQRVRLFARAPGYTPGTASLLVLDNEPANLQVHIPAFSTEGQTNLIGTVNLSTKPDDFLLVLLKTDAPQAMRLPGFLIVPPGRRSVPFRIDLPDNDRIEPQQVALVSAEVPGGPRDVDIMLIEDNESRQLTITLPIQSREGWGVVSGISMVSLAGRLATNLVITLLSDQPSKLLLPPSLMILAGQTSATFPITLLENDLLEGDVDVGVSATATGFTAGHALTTISDNEIPLEPALPTPFHLATNVLANTALSWELFDVGQPQPAVFEVYLAKTPELGPLDRVAITDQTRYQPRLLEPLTTYYWQIIARRAGSTTGPIWQFTTQGLDHFQFSPIGSAQQPLDPFPLSISAHDAFGTPVDRFRENLALFATGPSPHTPPRLLISEVESGDPDYVEVLNVSRLPVDLAGWTMTLYDQNSWPEPALDFQFPARFCPAGAAFRLREMGQPPGNFPNFNSGLNIRWLQEPTNNPIAVLLRDPRGEIADFFCAGTAEPEVIANPVLIPWSHWQGDTLPVNSDPDINYQRIGRADHNQAADWTLATGNGGVANPGLVLPFTDRRLLTLTPTNLFMTNGRWAGSVSLGEPSASAQLIVAGQDRQSTSAVFNVTLQNDLALTSTLQPDTVAVGGEVELVLMVSNSGPAQATGVVLANTLPPHTELLSVTGPAQPRREGAHLIFSLGDLVPMQTRGIRIRLQPTAAGSLTNRAVVTRLQPDAYAPNNVAQSAFSARWPLLSIEDVTVVEGDQTPLSARFPVRLSLPTSRTVQVEFATRDVTARAGEDYVARFETLEFLPGQTNATLSVAILGDRIFETDETFEIRMQNPFNARLARAQATGTILDDEPNPTLLVRSTSVVEGRIGFAPATFTIELAPAHSRTVSVHYATEPGTATPEDDYLPTAGRLVLPPGMTSTNLIVLVRGDRSVEPHESFHVVLSAAENAEITVARAQAIILNDDGYPGQADHLTWELPPTAHYVNHPFQVTVAARDFFDQLVPPFQQPVRVLAVRDAPRTIQMLSFVGHASTGSDSTYASTLMAIRSFFVDFTNTPTVQTDPSLLSKLLQEIDVFLVPAQDRAQIGLLGPLGKSWSETLAEFVERGGILIVCSENRDEHALLSRAGLLQADKFGTIRSNLADAPESHPLLTGVELPFEPPALARYVNHNGKVLIQHNRFAGVLSRPHGAGLTLLIGTDFDDRRPSLDRLLANAVRLPQAGQRDILPMTPITVGPFINGRWSGPATVAIPGESVFLLATNDSGLFGLSEPITVALRDDVAVQLQVSGEPTARNSPLFYTITVTNAGPSSALSVVLSNALPNTASPVSWTSSQGTCSLGGNGIQCAFGTIPAFGHATIRVEMLPTRLGFLTNNVSISRNGPDSYLPNNTAQLITHVVEATQATESIVVIEGDDDLTLARFPVRLFPPLQQPVQVSFETCELSASSPGDFLATNGLLRFAPGQSVQFIEVQVRGDRTPEPDETFCLRLTNPSLGVLSSPNAIATILNDDLAPPLLTISRAGDQIVLAWPIAPPDLELQATDSLTDEDGWRPVLATPESDGMEFRLTLPMTGAHAYYRLVHRPSGEP